MRPDLTVAVGVFLVTVLLLPVCGLASPAQAAVTASAALLHDTTPPMATTVVTGAIGQQIPAATSSIDTGGIFIDEVMFAPATGGQEWIELKNGSSSLVRLAGYNLTDEDGNWYRIPAVLPDVPPGAFVVVVFDGQGDAANDLDFGDNVATLHSPPGLTNIFEDGADQVALYRPVSFLYLPLVLRGSAGSATPTDGNPTSNIVSFVAWGMPPEADGQDALRASLWPEEGYVETQRAPGNQGLQSGGSIGVRADAVTHGPPDWRVLSVGGDHTGPGQRRSGPPFPQSARRRFPVRAPSHLRLDR